MRRGYSWVGGVAVLLAAMSLACAGDSDSGAVNIVEMDSAPFLSIGVEEGEDPYQLNRVFDAYVHDDGRVVISNSGSQELRIFDSAGVYVAALGRRGAGPMEFAEFSSQYLFPRPGQLVASDEGAMRNHIIGADLTFKETRRFTLYPDTPRPFIRGVASNGDWVAQAFANGGSLQGQPGQVLNSSYQLLRYDSLGTLVDTIVQLPSRPRIVNEHQGSIHFPYIPLSSEPVFTVDGDRVVVVSGSAPAMEIHSLSGELLAQHVWDRPQVRALEIWDEFKRRSAIGFRGQAADSARYMALYEKSLPLPEFAPMYVSVKGDGAGRFWLERFRMPDEAQRSYDIVTDDGDLVGTVTTPAGLTVLRVTQGLLIGRSRDSLGVERVQLFRVR